MHTHTRPHPTHAPVRVLYVTASASPEQQLGALHVSWGRVTEDERETVRLWDEGAAQHRSRRRRAAECFCAGDAAR